MFQEKQNEEEEIKKLDDVLTIFIYQLDHISYQDILINSTTEGNMEKINKELNLLLHFIRDDFHILEEFHFKITQLCIMYQNKQKQSTVSKSFTELMKEYDTPNEFYQLG